MKFEIASTEKINYSSDIIIIAIDNKNNLINASGLAKPDEGIIKALMQKNHLGEKDFSTAVANDVLGNKQFLLARLNNLEQLDVKGLHKFFNNIFCHLAKLNFKSAQICLCKFASLNELGAKTVVKFYARSALHNFYKINSVKSSKSSQPIVKLIIHLNKKYLPQAKSGLVI